MTDCGFIKLPQDCPGTAYHSQTHPRVYFKSIYTCAQRVFWLTFCILIHVKYLCFWYKNTKGSRCRRDHTQYVQQYTQYTQKQSENLLKLQLAIDSFKDELIQSEIKAPPTFFPPETHYTLTRHALPDFKGSHVNTETHNEMVISIFLLWGKIKTDIFFLKQLKVVSAAEPFITALLFCHGDSRPS